MEFAPDKTQDFKKLFDETYPRIRNFDGCRFLELYEDKNHKSTFYTISKWESVVHLEEYRKSELFRQTWSITKSYFSAPPMAYSLDKQVEDSINPF